MSAFRLWADRRFARAGMPDDQDLLTGLNVQVDAKERRLRLRAVLKGVILKRYDRFHTRSPAELF